jgi:hypothetical protein
MLKAGDKIKPEVFSISDNNYEIAAQSHFSAARVETEYVRLRVAVAVVFSVGGDGCTGWSCSPTTGDRGCSCAFGAQLTATISITGNTYRPITGWNVTVGPGVFNLGGAFDAASGTFTAPYSGASLSPLAEEGRGRLQLGVLGSMLTDP